MEWGITYQKKEQIIMHFNCCCCLLLFCALFLLFSSINGDDDKDIKRTDFPSDFLFGVATSAYQIEGGSLEDGKSPSNWDVFSHVQGRVNNGENGDVADDHYHRFTEDIEILHALGVNSYRFSISWSRVLPRGRFGEINPAGIKFYNEIIDSLLLRGIEPFVTIHHSDFPQELEDRFRSWLSPLMQDEFLHFAETCFKSFGDRVKYWTTINEPNLFAKLGYDLGICPPGRCSPPSGDCLDGNSFVEPLRVVHNMLLAHGKASKLYRERFQPKQGGFIGIVEHSIMYEPISDNELDREAANKALALDLAWIFDPVIFGNYPPEMLHLHGSELPQFSAEETEFMKNSIDFIGLNHYATLYAKDCILHDCGIDEDYDVQELVYTTAYRNGVPIGEPMGMPFMFVVPRGMEEIIDYVKNRYHNKPMFITENGFGAPKQHEIESQGEVEDVKRVDFYKAYLGYLAKAIRNGADVRGYFIWSFMDSFEWTLAYDMRFGLYRVDRQTLNRIPKLSAMWYRSFLKNNSLDRNESKLVSRNISKLGRPDAYAY